MGEPGANGGDKCNSICYDQLLQRKGLHWVESLWRDESIGTEGFEPKESNEHDAEHGDKDGAEQRLNHIWIQC